MKNDLAKMTDDQLRELAKRRNKKGSFTREAVDAQWVLWVRYGFPFSNSYTWKRDHTPIKKF